jgi:pre-mRNA-processing factor 6
MSIWAEPRPTRKSRSVDALKKSSDDPLIVCTVARLFWQERKIEKAREWFRRAVKADKDLGDVWGWWLKFEEQHGTEEYREIVKRECEGAEPRHGEVWQSVSKDDVNVGKRVRDVLQLVCQALV